MARMTAAEKRRLAIVEQYERENQAAWTLNRMEGEPVEWLGRIANPIDRL